MRNISFEGIGAVAATFAAEEGVKAGQVVSVKSNGTVGACVAGERFCGVALAVEDGFAAVQLEGMALVIISGEGVSAGWVKLAADGSGGAAAAESGTQYLVTSVSGGTAMVLL